MRHKDAKGQGAGGVQGWIRSSKATRTLLIIGIGCVFVLFVLFPRPDADSWYGPEKAQMEINGIELACAKLLSDAGRDDLFGFFNDLEGMREKHGSYQNMWNAVIPELLWGGRNAVVDLEQELRRKLGETYMTAPRDPWGNPYQFFAGPLTEERYGTPAAAYYFRSYRQAERESYTDRNGQGQTDYYYDAQAKADADGAFPDNPEADGLPGFPAPTGLVIYIWSLGKDGQSCQRVGVDLSPESVNVGPRKDFGDDINNWDDECGWEKFY